MLNPFSDREKPKAALPVFIFYLLALPLILWDYNYGRAFNDQITFHLPTIMGFLDQFDFSDYPSATTPGYHAILASLGILISDSEVFYKLVSSTFTASLIALLARTLSPRFGITKTLLLLLPMIFSIYIFPGGVWLLPDNLAWLSVAIILFIAIRIPLSTGRYITAGLTLVFAVLIRQPNIWLAAIIWSTAISYSLYEPQTPKNKAWIVTLSAFVTLPSFFLLYLFYLYWGGLVPPSLQAHHEHFSFSAPAFFFSAFAFYSSFYLPVMFSAIRTLQLKRKYYWISAGAALGFIAAIFPDTSYNIDLGRSSGLWNFVKLAPTIGSKSLLIIALSTFGGGIFVAMLCLLEQKKRLIVGLSTLAFIVSLIPNAFVYERYFSGFIFILIVIFLSWGSGINKGTKWVWMGPATFTLFNFLILIRGIY